MIKIPCLPPTKDEIGLEVGCDGPSLPILTIYVKAGGRKTFVLMNKEQATELSNKLQSLISEM